MLLKVRSVLFQSVVLAVRIARRRQENVFVGAHLKLIQSRLLPDLDLTLKAESELREREG